MDDSMEAEGILGDAYLLFEKVYLRKRLLWSLHPFPPLNVPCHHKSKLSRDVKLPLKKQNVRVGIVCQMLIYIKSHQNLSDVYIIHQITTKFVRYFIIHQITTKFGLQNLLFAEKTPISLFRKKTHTNKSYKIIQNFHHSF